MTSNFFGFHAEKQHPRISIAANVLNVILFGLYRVSLFCSFDIKGTWILHIKHDSTYPLEDNSDGLDVIFVTFLAAKMTPHPLFSSLMLCLYFL